jgi:hypothetical protein
LPHLRQACLIECAVHQGVVVNQVSHHAGRQRKQAAPKLLAALKDDAQAGVELRGVALVGAVGAACGGWG